LGLSNVARDKEKHSGRRFRRSVKSDLSASFVNSLKDGN